jgi:hypothetical protein
MYIFLVIFEEYFNWSGEINVKSVINALRKYSCIPDGGQHEWIPVQQDAKICKKYFEN